MSTENISKFEAAVAADPAIQTKLQEILEAGGEGQVDSVAALSREIGAPVTAEEILAGWGSDELSTEQLEGVAGGASGDERVKLILPRHLIWINPRVKPASE